MRNQPRSHYDLNQDRVWLHLISQLMRSCSGTGTAVLTFPTVLPSPSYRPMHSPGTDVPIVLRIRPVLTAGRLVPGIGFSSLAIPECRLTITSLALTEPDANRTQLSPALLLSSTSVLCHVPAVSRAGPVQVSVSNNGQSFVPGSHDYCVVRPILERQY